MVVINIKAEAQMFGQDLSVYSGIYEGNLDFYFADGSNNDVGKLYLDLSGFTPILFYDGISVKNIEVYNNILKSNSYSNGISYFEIKLSDRIDGSTILFNDEFYTNDGKDFVYPLKKTGNLSEVRIEIEKFEKENELFSKYWNFFLNCVKSNNYSEIVKNLDYPLVDKCSGELYKNESDAIKKLKSILSSSAWGEIDTDANHYRLSDHYAEMFEGKWYIQRNGSIFFTIVDGEIKISCFNCLFG